MRQTIVQLTTPDNMRGRASAAHSLAAMSANGIGKWEVGIMSDYIDLKYNDFGRSCFNICCINNLVCSIWSKKISIL